MIKSHSPSQSALCFTFVLFLHLICAQNCQNGGSYQDGVCHCGPKFEGNQCQDRNCGKYYKLSEEIDIHLAHGILQDDGTCKCFTLFPSNSPGGWEGEFCDLPKCANGIRINDSCVCNPDYAGVFCEGVIRCSRGRLENQIAMDQGGWNRYESSKCVCDQHWGGVFCDSIKCFYGQAIGGECKCLEGYYGTYCEDHKRSDDDEYEWDTWDNAYLVPVLIVVGLIVVGLTIINCYASAKKKGAYIELQKIMVDCLTDIA